MTIESAPTPLCLLPLLVGGGIFVTIFAVRQPTQLAQDAAETTDVSSLLTDHFTGGLHPVEDRRPGIAGDLQV